MIRVALAAEPKNFDADVRRKGLAAIAELLGEKPNVSRPGRRRKKLAASPDKIPAAKFPPFWRAALPEMLERYERRCSFLSLYLEHATGNPSVDHMIPKSHEWNEIYEWRNYRLCAATINSKKSDLLGIVDPFECNSGWFALELVAFQVVRGGTAPTSKHRMIDATLDLLNQTECCRAREEYVSAYLNGEIELSYLQRRAPFVALELQRQQRLRS